MKSAFEFPQVVDKKLAKEKLWHRILDPFDVPPSVMSFRVSPLGVVAKKLVGEFRMIHDLPRGVFSG